MTADPSPAPPDPAEIDALLDRGAAEARQGAIEAAVATLREAVAQLEGAEPGDRHVHALRLLGKCLIHAGEMDEALVQLQAAAQQAESLGGRIRLQAQLDLTQGLVMSGHHARAWDRIEPLMGESALAEEPDLHSLLLRLAGDVLSARGETWRALALLAEGLWIAEQHDDARSIAGCESGRGRILRTVGDLRGALEAHGRALAAFREVGDHGGVAAALSNMALIQIDLEQFADAERNAREGLQLAIEDESPRMQAGALRVLAGVLQKRGALDEARVQAMRSAEMAREQGAVAEAIAGLVRLGKIEHQAGLHEPALASLAAAVQAAREHEDRAQEAHAWDAVARVHLSRGDATAALEVIAKGQAIAEELRHTELDRRLHEAAHQAHEARGELREALEHQRRRYEIDLAEARKRVDEQLDRLHFQQEAESARQLAAMAEERARRRKADEIHHLSARLITAQESEQRRIGRDLHDDLGQRLAVLSLELAELAREAEGRSAADRARAQGALESTQGIAADVSRLSHQLHPAALEHLGLPGAMRGLCREMSEQSGVAIEFITDDSLPQLDPDDALGVFRIVQEALRNVLRHSGASGAEVCLDARDGELRVRIQDEGRGFDPDSASEPGIGLVSMRERAEILGGTFELETAPGAGVKIRVLVPAGPESGPQT